MLSCLALYELQTQGQNKCVCIGLLMILATQFLIKFFVRLALSLRHHSSCSVQSVAHLPWRMLTYKALNTFIDDLFSFVIKMPMLHRLACFRDDIIFFIFLYQKWIYRVDYKRVNEFGTVLMSPEEQERVMEEERQAALAKLNAESETKRASQASAQSVKTAENTAANVDQEQEDAPERQSRNSGNVEAKPRHQRPMMSISRGFSVIASFLIYSYFS